MSFTVANKRLLKEYKELIRDAQEGICAGPINEDNLLEWECFIRGPDDTPFEGGVFPATLSFPKVISSTPQQGILVVFSDSTVGLSSKSSEDEVHLRNVPSQYL
jgi:hypothetical protein